MDCETTVVDYDKNTGITHLKGTLRNYPLTGDVAATTQADTDENDILIIPSKGTLSKALTPKDTRPLVFPASASDNDTDVAT